MIRYKWVGISETYNNSKSVTTSDDKSEYLVLFLTTTRCKCGLIVVNNYVPLGFKLCFFCYLCRLGVVVFVCFLVWCNSTFVNSVVAC